MVGRCVGNWAAGVGAPPRLAQFGYLFRLCQQQNGPFSPFFGPAAPCLGRIQYILVLFGLMTSILRGNVQEGPQTGVRKSTQGQATAYLALSMAGIFAITKQRSDFETSLCRASQEAGKNQRRGNRDAYIGEERLDSKTGGRSSGNLSDSDLS